MPDSRLQNQYVEIDHPFFDVSGEPLSTSGTRHTREGAVPRLDWRQVLGGALIVIGVVLLVVGWVGISGTKNTYDQLSYFLSGGLGGAACVIIGATVLVTYEHFTDRQVMSQLDERLQSLEGRLSTEFTRLVDIVVNPELGQDVSSNARVPAASGRKRS